MQPFERPEPVPKDQYHGSTREILWNESRKELDEVYGKRAFTNAGSTNPLHQIVKVNINVQNVTIQNQMVSERSSMGTDQDRGLLHRNDALIQRKILESLNRAANVKAKPRTTGTLERKPRFLSKKQDCAAFKESKEPASSDEQTAVQWLGDFNINMTENHKLEPRQVNNEEEQLILEDYDEKRPSAADNNNAVEAYGEV